MHLQISGKLDQYINTHYNYLAYLSMILSFLLAVVQLIKWVRTPEEKEHAHAHVDHSGHSHQLSLKAKISAYTLLTIPLMVGLLFPTVSLDSTIVNAKGFNFPLSKDSTGSDDIRTQYLKPDTSIYFNKSDYQAMMEKVKKKYAGKDTIEITSANYLETMELLYDYPSEFIGKTIKYSGFVYIDPQNTDSSINAVYLFRFGIIHCIADSGVFGMLNHLPKDLKVKNNDWVSVTGKFNVEYYKPFGRTLPYLEVTNAQIIKKPSNPYVYRTF